jgi:leukotriene-A4 hydrolase
VRMTYRATLIVPRPLQAVMAAASVDGGLPTDATGGMQTFRFEMPQPIPSYLLAMAVGDLAAKPIGKRSKVFAEPSLLDAAAYEFADIDKMIATAEQLFGPYRWQQFDILVMPPSFPYGGMENPRLTFVTPTMLAGDRSLVALIEHELAHAWTGNLVTNATMEHFWLNEGVTVWAELRIAESERGREASELAAALGRQELDKALADYGADWPQSRLRTEMTGIDPDDVYSCIPYEKGYLFVRLLEETVGRARWDEFMRDYVATFAFQSITSERFAAFVEQHFPGVLAQVRADDWLYKPGVPSNAPVAQSSTLSAVLKRATEFAQMKRPQLHWEAQWGATEWRLFLNALPDSLPLAHCKYLDSEFHLVASTNREIQARVLVLGVHAGYAPAIAETQRFLGSVGRLRFVKPLYAALKENSKTAALATTLFAQYEERYHPITRAAVGNLLK